MATQITSGIETRPTKHNGFSVDRVSIPDLQNITYS